MKIFKEIPANKPITPLLDKVEIPADIRSFSIGELQTLSDELREFLLYSVGQSGGHLGGGLGVVELTIILHYLYNTPFDKLVWDVGHQAYPHKILTGRKNEIETIRKKDGLAPFPSINESDLGANDKAAHLVRRIGHNTRPINYLGLPAISVPIGFDENGLPLSIQLVGKPFSEDLLLRAAFSLEKEFCFWDKKPKI